MLDSENIQAIESLNPDWMGFIFYDRSPRYVREKPLYLPLNCKRVGVFVNSSEDEIMDKVIDYGLDLVQLHGNEDVAFCSSLRKRLVCTIKIIKMVSIKGIKDILSLSPYIPYVDYFLFENHTSSYGGSGVQFDWSILSHYQESTPFILSGGIGPNDARKVKQLNHPQLAGIDLNSGFEICPGLKSPEKLRKFINKIRKP